MPKLIYLPGKGWEKEFDTIEELTKALADHICPTCIAGDITYVDADGELLTEPYEDPIDVTSLDALLGTACGCEYMVEE